jgi:hypothetical protein
MIERKKLIACMMGVIAVAAAGIWADSVTTTITVGTNPFAAAVNPVTNRTYVANYGDGTVTVIDAAAKLRSSGPARRNAREQRAVTGILCPVCKKRVSFLRHLHPCLRGRELC